MTTPAFADIFQWEYINPADPSQGKQQSTTLCFGGTGVNGVPYASLGYLDLTQAYLIGADLTSANFYLANLTSADFSNANLTNAALTATTLTSANFTNAEVRGAKFDSASFAGFSAAQLYSTASYQNHDLTGIDFTNDDLSGWNFAGQNLTDAKFTNTALASANFSYANLTGVDFGDVSTTLTNADFSHAILTNAYLGDATLTNANFTDADVRGASFRRVYYTTNGLTAAQLYSTASYQNHDLTGIFLGGYNDLSRWNFAGQNLTQADLEANLTSANFSQANLTSADFANATLTGAIFTGAEVRGASLDQSNFTAAQLYSTASYQNHDLTGIDLLYDNLSGWNFAGQNLTNARLGDTLTSANFSHANLTNANLALDTLTGANFTGARVGGARFSLSNLTAAQLYSTASYQAHDLSGIILQQNDLSGWNFAGQNLTGADFSSPLTYYPATNLTGTDFNHANLTNGYFSGATLSSANFTAADSRGAQGLDFSAFPSAITKNLIFPDGHVAGLDLTAGQSLFVHNFAGLAPTAGQSLLVHNYHDSPVFHSDPIQIRIGQSMAMDPTGTLALIFDSDQWDSEISFAPGIPVSLGGTLDLSFAPGVDVEAQIGRTFQIFDWTGVTPTGSFSLSSEYAWDTSQLYTTGQVTLVPEPGSLALLVVVGIAPLLTRRTNQRRRQSESSSTPAQRAGMA